MVLDSPLHGGHLAIEDFIFFRLVTTITLDRIKFKVLFSQYPDLFGPLKISLHIPGYYLIEIIGEMLSFIIHFPR